MILLSMILLFLQLQKFFDKMMDSKMIDTSIKKASGLNDQNLKLIEIDSRSSTPLYKMEPE